MLQTICSVAERESFSKLARCLIIAPHPDDEVLGCGGLLAAHAMIGKETNILFLTEGEAAHKGCCLTSAIRQVGAERRRLAAAANEILGIKQEHLYFLGRKDEDLPQRGQTGFSAVAEEIAQCIKKTAPDAVYCPHPFESWPDHIAAEALTRTALKMLAPARMPYLYHYCVWFWYSMPFKHAWQIDWRRSYTLDISAQLPLKRQAMLVYLNALAPCGSPWIGKLPPQFLKAFDWDKELFFKADIRSLTESNQ